MKKFVFVTRDFDGLGFAKKIKEEGNEAIMAFSPSEKIKPEEMRSYLLQGKGMVSRFSLKDVMKRRSKMKDWYWIWDTNHSVEENEILRKEGFKVFGGGKHADTMEHDRDACLKLLKEYGINSPPTFPFTDTSKALKFIEQNEETAYVFKPDEGEAFETWVPESPSPEDANKELQIYLKSLKNVKSFILQERKEGIEVNAELWFTKGDPKFAYVNLETKKKISGDLGEMIGCAFDFGFEVPMSSRIINESIGKMIPFYKKINYTGFADLNFIVAKDGIWAFEKCERFGYNAHPNIFFNLNLDKISDTLSSLVDGTFKPNFAKGIGCSITAYSDHPKDGRVIQYPEKKEGRIYFYGVYKEGETLVTSGTDQCHFIMMGTGFTIPTAWRDAYELAMVVKFQNMSFRNDGDGVGYPSSPTRRYEALKYMDMF